jgi:hypothetical protein
LLHVVVLLPGITVAFNPPLPSMSRCPWFWARREMNENAAEANESDVVGGRIN